MGKTYHFGLLCIVAIVGPSLGWWCSSPRAAQALGVPLAWVGLAGDSNSGSPGIISVEPGVPVETIRLSEPDNGMPRPPGEVLNPSFNIIPGESNVGESNVVLQPAMYTQNQVMRWAYERSPEARLIEAEIDAVMRGVDPKDPDQCCSARLVRNVLEEVALARRHDDATHAAVAYHKLLAATQAVVFAAEAVATTDRLISMADEAERLEIPDGDPLKLRQTRGKLRGLETEHSFHSLKLRQELSRLTGRSESEVGTAIMTDALPHDAPAIIAGEAVSMALAQRHDLRAVETLCRELGSCNVDAARLLMGIVSPGAGLSLATAAKGLFQCLKDDKSDDDLNARRRQCRQLNDSLKIIIRNETLQAVLDVRSAAARLKLIDEQLNLAAQRHQKTSDRIKIDEAEPGSDLAIELELTELGGNRLQIQKELILALDDLNHAKGKPIP